MRREIVEDLAGLPAEIAARHKLQSARAAEKSSNLACRATATLLHAMAAKRLGHDEESKLCFQQVAAFVPQLEKTSETDWQWANVLVFKLLLDEAEPLFEAAAAAGGQAP